MSCTLLASQSEHVHSLSDSLRSASERRLGYHHREAQNHSPEHSRSPFLAGGMIFPPPPSGLLDPCQSSSNN